MSDAVAHHVLSTYMNDHDRTNKLSLHVISLCAGTATPPSRPVRSLKCGSDESKGTDDVSFRCRDPVSHPIGGEPACGTCPGSQNARGSPSGPRCFTHTLMAGARNGSHMAPTQRTFLCAAWCALCWRARCRRGAGGGSFDWPDRQIARGRGRVPRLTANTKPHPWHLQP